MLDLARLKDKNKAFCEELNWGSPFDDGICLNKDGSLMAGFFYRGPDLHSRSRAERKAVSRQINVALNQLGGGWSVWIEANKDETNTYPAANRSFFPDPISRMVDEERRQQFMAEGAHFETEYALILQYTPPMKSGGKVVDLIYDNEGIEQPTSFASATAILDRFKRKISEVYDVLRGVVAVRRMVTESSVDQFGYTRHHNELVDYLAYDLTRIKSQLDIKPGAYLDGIICGDPVDTGDTPKIGDQYVAVLWLQGFPEFSNPNVLDIIDCLPIPMRWSSRYIYMDATEAEKQIGKIEKKWRQKARGLVATVTGSQKITNQDASDEADRASEAKQRTSNGQVGTGFYTPVVVFMDPSREVVLERARLVRQTVIDHGFMATIETLNAVDAWIGSLPGHSVHNVRRPPMHTDNLADLLPLAGIWTGSPTCPCPLYPPNSPALLHAATTGATPFRFNLHDGDVGHTLIFGPTGNGKTSLLATVAMQALRYAGMRIWSFDYKRGLMATVKACRGRYYDIAGNHGLSFCPLSILKTRDDLVWGSEYIATLFELQTDRQPTVRQKDDIHRTLQAMMSGPHRSLTHFQGLVQDREVREVIQHYTLAGPLGHLLDAEQDSLEYSDFMDFEMEELLALKEAAIIPTMLYLFKRFDMRLNGQPTLLLLDEASQILRHPLFRAKVLLWLRVLRSKNCAVVLSTQYVSDATHSGMLAELMEACRTKIALPNVEARLSGTPEHPGPADFYRALGRTDVEIGIIAEATPKKHYYVWSPGGQRLIDLGLGPVALAFAGATTQDDIAEILELERVYGEEVWPFKWLERQQGRSGLWSNKRATETTDAVVA